MIEDKNTYLHKWLNNELTEAEFQEFKTTDVYKENIHLVKPFEGAKIPRYETNSEYAKLKSTNSGNRKKKGKLIQLQTNWMKIAASLILFLSASYFVYDSFKTGMSEYNTSVGEFTSVALPDLSRVTVNAKSELSFNAKNWDNERAINLNGEAYFEVAKGKKFTVNTPQGTIAVLGTKFNVKQRNTIFEVVCFEGKVKVSHKNKDYILTKGDVFCAIENATKLLKEESIVETPIWRDNRSYFTAMPIYMVFEDLQLHYDVTITLDKNIDITNKFTGGYYYNDTIKNTLTAICTSLNLSYTIKGKNIYIK